MIKKKKNHTDNLVQVYLSYLYIFTGQKRKKKQSGVRKSLHISTFPQDKKKKKKKKQSGVRKRQDTTCPRGFRAHSGSVIIFFSLEQKKTVIICIMSSGFSQPRIQFTTSVSLHSTESDHVVSSHSDPGIIQC